jgi:hypothetical protein
MRAVRRLRELCPCRPGTPAVTVTAVSVAVPVSMTFRNLLWWAVGTTGKAAGFAELVRLVIVSALVTALVVPIVVRLTRR